jgi:hypothetical protein
VTPTCEPLEPRDGPVSLLFDWTHGAALLPWRGLIEATATEFAARLTPHAPLGAFPHAVTADTPWGPVPLPPVPADTLRVYVGPVADPAHLGEAGPVGWHGHAEPPVRSPGMALALNPAADWSRHSLPSVVRHEVLHGVGVYEHSTDPAALMAPGLPAGADGDATPADATLAATYGWRVDLPPALPPAPAPPTHRPQSLADLPADAGVIVRDPYGLPGWQLLSAKVARQWAAAGNLGRWEPA